jgi:hypothetical protein
MNTCTRRETATLAACTWAAAASLQHGVQRIEGDLAAQALGDQDQRTGSLPAEGGVERLDHLLPDGRAAVALVDDGVRQAIVQQAILEHAIEAGAPWPAFAFERAIGGGSRAVDVELVFR